MQPISTSFCHVFRWAKRNVTPKNIAIAAIAAGAIYAVSQYFLRAEQAPTSPKPTSPSSLNTPNDLIGKSPLITSSNYATTLPSSQISIRPSNTAAISLDSTQKTLCELLILDPKNVDIDDLGRFNDFIPEYAGEIREMTSNETGKDRVERFRIEANKRIKIVHLTEKAGTLDGARKGTQMYWNAALQFAQANKLRSIGLPLNMIEFTVNRSKIDQNTMLSWAKKAVEDYLNPDPYAFDKIVIGIDSST